MSPAALLAAGLLIPPAAPPQVAPPAGPPAFTPAPPAAVLEEVVEPRPWLARLGPAPPEWIPDFTPEPAPPVRLLEPATGGGPGAWVTETSLLGSLTGSRGTLRGDVWTDFNDTKRAGAQVVTTTWVKNLGVDAEAHFWRQSRDPFAGDRLGGEWATGDLNAVFKVADHARGRLRTGGGAAWIVRDDGEVEVGPQATIAVDFGLRSHAIAGFEVDYGVIDGDDLFRWRAGGGWAFKWAQVTAGYDKYELGDEDRAGCYAGVLFRY